MEREFDHEAERNRRRDRSCRSITQSSPSSLLGDITFVLKTGPQPAERTRPDRKGIWFARPSSGPTCKTTPFDPGSISPRSTKIYHMSHAANRAQRSIRGAMTRARPIPRHAIKASGRTHRSTRKAKDHGRPRSSPHDQDHYITADHIPYTVDPMSANKKPTYAVLTILSPINLNRIVKT
ncbi:unnamed protein product [Microthlaspi erraticum]|uniref:Uncharacterized protein n=1 Tax=Microthlaspi erraticum TaxID=1685480 RepID=A0A6D2IUZ1_9BRAS|nr:unnamed protein product [Microthlaspi erraticum]